ncbi:hypothetical protein WEH80_18695 [Actinomycetes bacterium KLBMP 9759]
MSGRPTTAEPVAVEVTIEVAVTADTAVLTVCGSASDRETAGRAETLLGAVLALGTRTVIVDVTAVARPPARLMRRLLAARPLLRAEGRRLVVAGPAGGLDDETALLDAFAAYQEVLGVEAITGPRPAQAR